MIPAISPPVLESRERLSRSGLWQLQRAYFEDEGLAAWGDGAVPHFITCNPFIARSYARVIVGFLRDARARGEIGAGGAPIHIVELGAGSGRLGWHILRALARLEGHPALDGIAIRYVLTDFADRTIEAWRSNPRLRPLVAAGRLDFARFDLERDETITLCESGDVIGPGTLAAPLVVIANYVFDSVPQDAFYVEDGTLHESLVTVSAAATGRAGDDSEAGPFGLFDIAYERRPTEAAGYYDDPAWNRILDGYRRTLDGAAVSFPCAGLDAIRRLRALSAARTLLLTGDKGHDRGASIVGVADPVLSVHGSFSLMVNYHAIAEYVRGAGGTALQTEHPRDLLNVCAFLLGPGADDCRETRQAFADAIDAWGPHEYFRLKKGLDQIPSGWTLAQLLSVLALSGWDARVLEAHYERLLHAIEETPPTGADSDDLMRAIRAIWDAYLPIGEEHDVAFQLATLLCKVEAWAEAVPFLQSSLDSHGPHPATYFNLALCHQRLGAHSEREST
jgi:hypothetical protein